MRVRGTEESRPSQARVARMSWSGRLAVCEIPYRETRWRFSAEGVEDHPITGRSPSRTTDTEGHPVYTSEVWGARKIGEESARSLGNDP